MLTLRALATCVSVASASLAMADERPPMPTIDSDFHCRELAKSVELDSSFVESCKREEKEAENSLAEIWRGARLKGVQRCVDVDHDMYQMLLNCVLGNERGPIKPPADPDDQCAVGWYKAKLIEREIDEIDEQEWDEKKRQPKKPNLAERLKNKGPYCQSLRSKISVSKRRGDLESEAKALYADMKSVCPPADLPLLNPNEFTSGFKEKLGEMGTAMTQREYDNLNCGNDAGPDDCNKDSLFGARERVIGGCTSRISSSGPDVESHRLRGQALLSRYYSTEEIADAKGALSDFTAAIELAGPRADLYLDRGNAYGAIKRHDLAIADYSKAAELAPTNAVAFANRGGAYHDSGDDTQAIVDYDRAVSMDPENKWSRFGRAKVLEALGRNGEAVSDYRKVISLSGEDKYGIDSALKESKEAVDRLESR